MKKVCLALLLFCSACFANATADTHNPGSSDTITIGIADEFSPDFWPQVLGPHTRISQRSAAAPDNQNQGG